MTQTEHGRFETANASRYLQQLCKHFDHKLPVEFDPQQGKIEFGFGTASLRADDTALTVEIPLADVGERDRARMVIDKHLARFAFREAFEHMEWRD
jgi:hypothetical protein